MIRAFPALALAGALIPSFWAMWDGRASPGGPLRAAFRRHGSGAGLLIGAAACAVLLGFLSSLTLSPTAWGDWLHKVATLDRSGSTNEISLRALVAGNGSDRDAILSVLWPLRGLGIAASVIAVAAAARGRPPHQTAALALLLVPIFFSPSNYYLHLVCLLPLIAEETLPALNPDGSWLSRRDAASWLALFTLCSAQYWTVLERDIGLHFRFATALYFAMMGFLLVNACVQSAERAHAYGPLTRQSRFGHQNTVTDKSAHFEPALSCASLDDAHVQPALPPKDAEGLAVSAASLHVAASTCREPIVR
jgi:hypothetical protein